jgi:hypothetical protein
LGAASTAVAFKGNFSQGLFITKVHCACGSFLFLIAFREGEKARKANEKCAEDYKPPAEFQRLLINDCKILSESAA